MEICLFEFKRQIIDFEWLNQKKVCTTYCYCSNKNEPDFQVGSDWMLRQNRQRLWHQTVICSGQHTYCCLPLFLPAGDWDCHALDPTVWHVSLSEVTAWQLCLWTTFDTSNTPANLAAPCDMAAIQRRRPPDRTHHAEQEVGLAPRGRLPSWSEGKQEVNLLVRY